MITHRSFDDSLNDFDTMYRFLQQEYLTRRDNFIWLFSRLGDWKFSLWNNKKTNPAFFSEHAHLWLDPAGELLGFAINEDGDDIFFILTRHDQIELYPEMLDWAITHWRPLYQGLKTEVHEFQVGELAYLEQQGFTTPGGAATTRAYDLLSMEEPRAMLPAGFKIVNMVENTDHLGRALLSTEGYVDPDKLTNAIIAMLNSSCMSPAYDPQFDLSVVTADGMHVAKCVGFVDPGYGVAEIEKVRTHSQYRRQGLAEAVIRECFQRLKKKGIKRAYITGYKDGANALYEKLGPCGHKQWFHYEV
jgi:ribosomal protein S18 acetylase RimI-like enzyme